MYMCNLDQDPHNIIADLSSWEYSVFHFDLTGIDGAANNVLLWYII